MLTSGLSNLTTGNIVRRTVCTNLPIVCMSRTCLCAAAPDFHALFCNAVAADMRH